MKFNFSLRGRQPADTHYALFKAGMPDDQWDLYIALLSASPALSSSAMVSPAPLQEQELSALRSRIRLADRDFMARLAVGFAQHKHFRALAFFLTAELAALYGNDERTAKLIAEVISHPVEIAVWMAHYKRAARREQRPTRVIRKVLGILFNQLDEFQYSRCNRQMQLALREALILLHPKAVDQVRKTLFTRIIRDQITARTTWAQEWRALYQLHYDSPEQRQVTMRDKWKEGISSFRIGYTALLDNLRPMLCAGVSGKVLKLAAEYLGNATAVSRSGASALRILEAYRELQRIEQGGKGMLAEALERAVLESTWARTDFGGEGISVIAMDVSNSMRRPVNGCSGAHRFDIAPLLSLLWKSRGGKVITGIIGNTWKLFELPQRPVLLTVDEFRSHDGEAGYGINAWLVLQDLLRRRLVVDRVLIFTDSRLWDNRSFNQPAGTDLGDWWRRYQKQLAPHARLYLFDLAGNGSRTLECHEDGVRLIAGWNEKMLEALDVLDRDREMSIFGV
jgi:60 kDa SS-A/Ro ribonucleoprotein